VLHIVEGQGLTLHPQQGVIPRAGAERSLPEIPDRIHRIVVEDQIDRRGVVEVEPVRELFVPVELRDADALQPVEIILEEPAVGGAYPSVTHAIDPRRMIVDQVSV